MFNDKHILTKQPLKKLDKKLLGPFRVERIIFPIAIRLDLPPWWRVHNLFHVFFLEPYRVGIQEIPNPDQVLRKDDPVVEEDYKMDEVVGSVQSGSGVKYLVKWQGWPARKYWTWEPFDHFFTEEPVDV